MTAGNDTISMVLAVPLLAVFIAAWWWFDRHFTRTVGKQTRPLAWTAEDDRLAREQRLWKRISAELDAAESEEASNG